MVSYMYIVHLLACGDVDLKCVLSILCVCSAIYNVPLVRAATR